MIVIAPIPWMSIDSITANATVQKSWVRSSAGRSPSPMRNAM